MALTSALLASELLVIADAHPPDEPTAIADWSTAWDNYMATSTAAAAPLNPVIAVAAKAAMMGAMTGLNTAGPAAVTAGVLAYWGALSVPLAWGASIAPTAPPPGLAGLAAALVPVFLANTVGALSNVASTLALAAVIHPLNLGGTTTLIIPADTPVL